MKRLRALVVEDDDRIFPSIEDVLFSLGHDAEHVTNQAGAEERLEAAEYDYVLLDLEIPSRPGRGGASTEFGVNLLSAIRTRHSPARLPVIIMTAHGSACVDLTSELTRLGANDFISKPFAKKGRTLAGVIRKVLKEDGCDQLPCPPVDAVLRPLDAVAIVYGPDRIEMFGETIAELSERGNFWAALQHLKERKDDGRFEVFRAKRLARSFKGHKASQNTVSSCVGALRKRISEVARRHGYRCEGQDIVMSGGPGYRFNPTVKVEAKSDAEPARGDMRGHRRDIGGTSKGHRGDIEVTFATNVPSTTKNVPVNARQVWVLDELRAGRQVVRTGLERQFSVGAKTAKRDLGDLVSRGLIEFVRAPHPGFYRMRTKKAITQKAG